MSPYPPPGPDPDVPIPMPLPPDAPPDEAPGVPPMPGEPQEPV
ncbi:hypothetical protein J2851_001426 [Azospirillum rugosum]|uniref:Uncharacterized protein n=1 Tax=Azospirillum rugosum TaxID=416170 RepID=A0ABS4SGI8_9PROT|nr:hypothetical protein [Azospirillum rugosum]MDQ0524511.1 hypothetical protein [Azospirillum rugosum]